MGLREERGPELGQMTKPGSDLESRFGRLNELFGSSAIVGQC